MVKHKFNIGQMDNIRLSYMLCNLLISANILILILSVDTFSQPRYEWIRYYHHRTSDAILDVFRKNDGGFALAGFTNQGVNFTGFWLVITDNNGNMTNQYVYTNNFQPNFSAWCYSVIQTEDAGYLLGGRYRQGNSDINFTIIKVDEEGNQQWWNSYHEGSADHCYAVVETKEGLYVGAGRVEEQGFTAFAVMVNENGELIWDNIYDDASEFRAMRETEDGLIFAGKNSSNSIILKTDFNGEIEWFQTYDGDFLSGLVSCDGQGFAACGGSNHDWYLLRINNDGDELWSQNYSFLDSIQLHDQTDYASSLARFDDGGFALIGDGDIAMGNSCILRTDHIGNEQWRRVDRNRLFGSVEDYQSVVINEAGNIIVAGRATFDGERGNDGILVKLQPDGTRPEFLEWNPFELDFSVLAEDSVIFWVRAEDVQDWETLSYLWIWNNDTLELQPQDTTVVIRFDEMRDNTVSCIVSDGFLDNSIRWVVHVTDLYIASHTPDSTTFSIRRGRSLDFGLEYRATDDGPVTIDWYKSDEGDGFPISHDPNTTLTFDFTGDVRVEGLVYRGETEDNVIWDISVRSVVSVFRPQQRNITAYMDTTIMFAVEPFNPESPDLRYEWLVDGDNISEDQSVLLDFDEPREYSVIAHIYDGMEGNTLVWNITVLPDGADDGGIGIPPYAVGLSAYPNPFNSSTTIRYSLPQTLEIKLHLIDLSGRVVETLFDGVQNIGSHSVNLKSGKLSNGIYFVRLSGVEFSQAQKIIVLK